MTDERRLPDSKHFEADCWCHPKAMMVCAECEDSTYPVEDCWKCAGEGLVPHDGSDEDAIYIHNDGTAPEEEK